MQESKLKRIWEQNKRFFLITGGGFAAFLVLSAIVSSFTGGAERLVEQASRLTEESRKLRAELKAVYGDLQRRIDDYENHEETLRQEISLPPLPVASRLAEGALLVQFNETIEKVWQEAKVIADRQGVELPERLSPDDFSYDPQDGAEEFRRYYAYLAVTRRAMLALLESGMKEVLRPDLVSEEYQPIADNGKDAAMMLRGVRFVATGPYEAWVRTLESIQVRGDVLQAQILSLAPAKGAADGRLRGDVMFASLDLVRADESGAPIGGKAKAAGKRKSRIKLGR